MRMRWLNDITDSMDEFEEAPEVGDGQGSLECCSPWGHKELDTTEQLNRLLIHDCSWSSFAEIIDFSKA